VGRIPLLLAVACLLLALTGGIARAGVTDPGETGGPFDIRRVGAAPAGSDRIELTVRFWPGFTVASVPLGPAYDRRRHVLSEVEGAPDGDFTDGAYNHEGFFFRRDGRIWFRNGEFGSSPCCWTTPVARLDRSTLRVRFIPWWVRLGEADNRIAIRYRVATRSCTDEECLRDQTRWGYRS